MLWIFLAIVWLLVIGGSIIALKSTDPKNPNAGESKAAALLVAIVATGVFGLATAWKSVARVDTGHVGIVRTFGRISGQVGPGVNFIAPWKTYDSINVQVQKKTFYNLTAFSQETQNVYIQTTINYSVAPEDVQGLIRRVGTDWFDRLVPNNLNQAFKDETVKFSAVDIAPNREVIRKDVLTALRSRLAPYSIDVNDLNIDNIQFSKQFEQAIEAKQEATQSALRAKAQVAQAQYEAQSRVAKAKGEADANVTIAEGQAEANRKLNASLSPNVLQYIAIQKLAGNVKIALLPSGSGSLIDPTKLLQGATGK